MQGEGDTGCASNGFKSERTGGPGWAGDDLKRDQLIRAQFDDLIVAIDASAARPFQALLVHGSGTRRFAGHRLYIEDGWPPAWVVHPVQDEIEYLIHWPVNRDTFFRVSHDVSPFACNRIVLKVLYLADCQFCFASMGLELDDQANFDGASYCVGDHGRHRASFAQVFAIQDVEAGEVLLRFGEWAIGHHHFAVANADD
jgi:hypothetical protein